MHSENPCGPDGEGRAREAGGAEWWEAQGKQHIDGTGPQPQGVGALVPSWYSRLGVSLSSLWRWQEEPRGQGAGLWQSLARVQVKDRG